MPDASTILEKRTFRLLPGHDIGFAKPAIEYDAPDGTRTVQVSRDCKAPEPELARKPGDPGYWTVTVWLPVGSTPVSLVPDPDGPTL